MHDIIFYEDRSGHSPVLERIAELESRNDKDSRIRLTKIRDYVKLLSIQGTYLPNNIAKFIEDGIWELRPIDDRIFFAAVVNDAYVLLHSYIKKSQKTPRREIEQAKRELKDYKERTGIK